MDEYTKRVIHYLNNPQFQGTLKNSTHKLSLKSSECGDWNDIYLFVENNIIKDIAYENSGCALNIATLEIFCLYLKDKELQEIHNLSEEKVKKELDFPPEKAHCITLVKDTLLQADN